MRLSIMRQHMNQKSTLLSLRRWILHIPSLVTYEYDEIADSIIIPSRYKYYYVVVNIKDASTSFCGKNQKGTIYSLSLILLFSFSRMRIHNAWYVKRSCLVVENNINNNNNAISNTVKETVFGINGAS